MNKKEKDEVIDKAISNLLESGKVKLKFSSTRWRHKVTGEIKTVIGLSEMRDYEKLD